MKATITSFCQRFLTSAYRGASKMYRFPAQTCSEGCRLYNQFCSEKRALWSQSASSVGNRHYSKPCSNLSYNFHHLSSFASNPRHFSSHLNSGSKADSPASTIQSLIMSEEQRMEAKAFVAIFPDILKDITENSTDDPEMNEAFKWFSEAIQYNALNGKRTRGLTVVLSYKVLIGLDNCSPKELMLARILGWCVEMLQAYLVVTDDIMDQSSTRRGLPCWYKHENVGLMAVNDAAWMDNSIYCILRKHFSNRDCYMDLVNLFIEFTRKTLLGQCLDMLSNPPNKRVDLNLFTAERHTAMMKYKTAFYSFSLPVRLALYLAGCREERIHAKAESILIKIGYMFQVEENYGIQKPECIKKVKEVYNELNLQDLYFQYKAHMYQEVVELIRDVRESDELRPEIFYIIELYKRKK